MTQELAPTLTEPRVPATTSAIPTGSMTPAVEHVRRQPRADAGVFVRGIAALIVSQGFTWVAAAVITYTMPRYLGSANLGRYSFAVAVFILTEVAADIGISTYLNRQVARDNVSAPRFFTAAVVSRFIVGMVAAGALVLFFNIFPSEPVLKLTIDILCINVVVDTLALAAVTLNGLLQIKWIAVAQAVNKLVVAALVVVALRAGYGAPGVAAASLLGAVAGHIVNLTVLLRAMRPVIAVDLRLCRQLVIGGLPFFMMSAALIVYSQIDTVMLAVLTRAWVVGWYNAALRIIAIPGFVPVIVMALAFPALSATGQDSQRFRSIACRSIQAILVVTVPVAVGLILLPDRITGIFRYPADFSNSWPLIQLLALGMPLIGVDMVVGGALIAHEKQIAWTKVGIAAAVLNPLINLIAIPYTQSHFSNGALGAAGVTSLTELFMMVMGLRLLPSGTLDRSLLVAILRILVASAPMAVVVWIVRSQPLVITIAMGGLVYGAACLLTRAVTIHDIVSIWWNLIRRRVEAAATI